MPIARFLLRAAFVAAAPLLLISCNVRALTTAPQLYSYGFDRYGAVWATGIERDDLIDIGAEIRDYFNNDAELLDVTSPIYGARGPVYNEREILHMRDVKALVRVVFHTALATGLFIVAFVAAGLAASPRAFPRELARLTAWGAASTLALVGVAAMLSLTGFSQTFYVFHLIAFTNDLWQLEANDNLLMMFPQGFFFDSTMLIVAATVSQALWLLFASTLALGAVSARAILGISSAQTLLAIAASLLVLRFYPQGFTFEATMLFTIVSVVQTLAALVAWGLYRRGGPRRSAPRPRRAQDVQRASGPRAPSAERVAGAAFAAYQGLDFALAVLAPMIESRRRRDNGD